MRRSKFFSIILGCGLAFPMGSVAEEPPTDQKASAAKSAKKTAIRDRVEDVLDRREDVRDRREDVRDRREDVRDRRDDAPKARILEMLDRRIEYLKKHGGDTERINKLEQKKYYRHSGYPGGLKEQTLAQMLEKTPTRVIKQAVKGMLPKNTVGRRMLSRLKLYAGSEHPHEAQIKAGEKAVAQAASEDAGQES